MSAKALTPLWVGDHVRIQPADTYRCYHVRTAGGQVFRRNRRHLSQDKTQSITVEAEVFQALCTQYPRTNQSRQT